jgi:MFS family permease
MSLSPAHKTFYATLLRIWQQASTNMFYIALPLIAIAIGISAHTAKLTISSFFMGYTLSGFLSGFIIARYSMQRILFIAVVVFTVGTATCMAGKWVPLLFVGRILQAFSVGLLPTVSKTILATITGEQRGNMFSYSRIGIQFITSLFIILTGYLISYLPWQLLFLVMFLLSLLSYLPLYFSQLAQSNETHTQEAFDFSGYWALLKDWRFTAWCFAYAASSAMTVVYFAGVVFVLTHTLHVKAHFVGWVIAIVSFIQVFGLWAAILGAKRCSEKNLFWLGLWVIVLGSLCLLWFNRGEHLSTLNLLWPFCVTTIGLGVFYGPFNNMILQAFPQYPAEYIMSILGTWVSLLSMLATMALAFLSHDSATPIGILLLVLIASCFICLLWVQRRSR